ncbi:hypothetical protein [Robiginitalea aurantiaca]|uniref:Uncharacterized protein n=1 Tax=Robiginitalea aurantiaca TaxID=3056915 RepID=A0ABT7WFZ6_9FLAO|nr:hypothetical protein [Robiginitalea aurantiaca]MDM9631841.1 hypothetical protein [Robiginitalea aurantiaca]
MKKLALTLVSLCLTGTLFAQEIPPSDWQIKTALMAVPSDYKDGAAVYGYDADGNFTKLREGTNEYIALADDPTRENFSTAAYHKELDPFMARGRELRKQGKTADEIFDIREAEVRAGTLALPDKTTLCIFSGKVNPETKEIEDPYVRYVFYVPFATGASTGLPTTPTPPGHAWLMNPGTHRAHIMITPPRQG